MDYKNDILIYPGDLILCPGRRVCRKSPWLEPQYLGNRLNPNADWICGTLMSVSDGMAIVRTRNRDEWLYPLNALHVDHTHEIMSNDQYRYALLKLRGIIADGYPLVALDVCDVGNKFVYVSWGLDEDKNCYLARSVHRPLVWPLGMPKRQGHQYCPLDRNKGELTGCFYRCRAFERGLDAGTAIALFDEAIDCAREV